MGILDALSSCLPTNENQKAINELPAQSRNCHTQTTRSDGEPGTMTAQDYDCSICLTGLQSLDADRIGVVAPFKCTHQYCEPCFRDLFDAQKHRCPQCRAVADYAFTPPQPQKPPIPATFISPSSSGRMWHRHPHPIAALSTRPSQPPARQRLIGGASQVYRTTLSTRDYGISGSV